ncbi:MAG: insulinase family protein [Deltaproteobacteria bacterium]|nr:insulinase family protein [Deltaproteobacteria bacterium]
MKGRVFPIELGDDRAAMIGLAMVALPDERLPEALVAAQLGVDQVPGELLATRQGTLGEVLFNQLRQTATYALFAGLEEESDRDTRFAAHVLAGIEPGAALGAEIQGLREMTREEAARIARAQLAYKLATVVVLQPRDAQKSGVRVELARPIHDLGQRRDPPDLAEAQRPVSDPGRLPGLPGVVTRRLPNGLQVVLLPLTSVPTVDVRLIFGSGTADDPPGKRGTALVAGHGLTWNPRHVNDALLFLASGGTDTIEIATDHTAFGARGLDMHVDFLLAGIRRWVRDGTYGDDAEGIVAGLRTAAKQPDDQGRITDAWRAARFGAQHPYAEAGIVRHVSDALAIADAARFRVAHYTPDNATLVIAGGFDPALAGRWIDHLFGDWAGVAQPRTARPARLEPASIAIDEELVQVHVQIAMPAVAAGRAEQLVAAEMLAELAGDVRHQLGASYGLHAELDESRLATSYVLGGSIDAPRASEGIELLRARLEQLRTDPDAAARAFLSARRRLLTQLAALTGSASTLVTRVQRDVELERAPLFDRQTAMEVQQLTIGRMALSLAELDLERAVVLMRGPAAELDRAFAVLGRTATRVSPATPAVPVPVPVPVTTAARTRRASEWLTLADLEDPLTLQGPASRLTLGLMPGWSTGTVFTHGVTGYTVTGEVGYRRDHTTAIGVHASFGRLRGEYETPREANPQLHAIEIQPFALAGFVQATAYDQLWAAFVIGVHLDRVTDDGAAPEWISSIGVGLEAGIDLVQLRGHRLAVHGRITSELLSAGGYTAITLGLGYRR